MVDVVKLGQCVADYLSPVPSPTRIFARECEIRLPKAMFYQAAGPSLCAAFVQLELPPKRDV